jgi:hypothetical protein
MKISTILWRRIDTAGHDACRLVDRDALRRLEGTAVNAVGFVEKYPQLWEAVPD